MKQYNIIYECPLLIMHNNIVEAENFEHLLTILEKKKNWDVHDTQEVEDE